MENDAIYTVLPIAGNFMDVLDPTTDMLRFDGLSWTEAVELCRLSFMQGFQCVLWQQAGVVECGET